MDRRRNDVAAYKNLKSKRMTLFLPDFFEPYIIIQGGPDPARLAARPLPKLGAIHPGAMLTTSAAAKFLGVHPETLLRWHRKGRGPHPIDRTEHMGPGFCWNLGRLIEFWEANNPTLARPRSLANIWEDWVNAQTAPLLPLPPDLRPIKPSRRQRKRRLADARRKWRRMESPHRSMSPDVQ